MNLLNPPTSSSASHTAAESTNDVPAIPSSQAPHNTTTPDTPHTPDNSDNSDNSDTSDIPSTPGTSDIPDTPATSDNAHAPTHTTATDPSLSAEDLAVTAPKLSLTDFLDLRTLREMQDSFNAVTRLSTSILDADGKEVLVPSDEDTQTRRDEMLAHLVTDDDLAIKETDPAFVVGEYSAPIIIQDQVLGSITIDRRGESKKKIKSRATPHTDEQIARGKSLAHKLGIDSQNPDRVRDLIDAFDKAGEANHATAMQFLYLMANAIARLCYQEYHLRQSVDDLGALYKLSRLIAGHGDLQHVLDTAAVSATEALKAKASSIRLIQNTPHDDGKPDEPELVVKSVHNLSQPYVDKGPILVNATEINHRIFNGEAVYVEDMATDPRVIYKKEAKQEGLVSFMSVALVTRGRPIGVVRVYTAEKRKFSASETKLLRAIADLAATAIENARLSHQEMENHKNKQQLRLGADVQRRLMPAAPPQIAQIDIAARYVPSLDLGGDFYDFIPLAPHQHAQHDPTVPDHEHTAHNTGIAIGDVVGKGVAASLLMASVRASLRAYAQDIYDLDEIMTRVNHALTGDTKDSEFATLFYGVLDPQSLRMTYCNAGHDPPLLLRDGQLSPLDVGGMIVGIDHGQHYDKAVLQLEPNDMVLFYTDGLVDAQNFDGKRFGRDRIADAMKEAASAYPDGVALHALNHILWKMRNHIGLNPPVDDTTLAVLRVADDATPQIPHVD